MSYRFNIFQAFTFALRFEYASLHETFGKFGLQQG